MFCPAPVCRGGVALPPYQIVGYVSGRQHIEVAVNIYIRLNEDKIAGLALVVGDSREFVFINIVGNMDPAQMGSLIGRLAGEQMGPELLSRIDESVVDGGGVADD